MRVIRQLAATAPVAFLGLLLAQGCNSNERAEGLFARSGEPGSGGGGRESAHDELNESMHLPAGSFVADEGELETDPSIEVGSPDGAPTAIMPGDVMMVQIPFSDPGGNVNAAGIRWGDSGPIHIIPIPGAMGHTSGTLQFPLQVPSDICGDLSDICHDIRCYEFAVTSIGTISRANIMNIALACNDCSEPSCQELLMDCDMGGGCNGETDCAGGACVDGQCVGEGALRFTLRWDATTDLDLHVNTPSGSHIYYASRSADSGMLDVDDTSGGSGSVENVFFTMPPGGTYTYWVKNFSGSAAAPYVLEVYVEGSRVDHQSGSLPASSGTDSAMYSYSYGGG